MQVTEVALISLFGVRSDTVSYQRTRQLWKLWKCILAMWQQMSPKIPQNEITLQKPQSIINSVWKAIRIWGAVTLFLTLWPPPGIDPHQDILLCFWLKLSESSSLMTVKRNIDPPRSCNKKEESGDRVGNMLTIWRKSKNQYSNDSLYWFIIKS